MRLCTQVRRTLYPHVAQTLRYGDRTVSRDIVFSIDLFVFADLASMVVVAMVLAAANG